MKNVKDYCKKRRKILRLVLRYYSVIKHLIIGQLFIFFPHIQIVPVDFS